MLIRRAAAVIALACASASMATPLKMEYTVQDIGGGQYRYNITLTLDNNDGSWIAGQTFNWIICGDSMGPEPTALPDFVGDLPAPGPFADEGYSTSGGGHNGPTLLDFGVNFDFHGWEPTAVGDSLVWSGTSSINLGVGDMKWSNLIGSGIHADYEVAILQTGRCIADFNSDGGVDGADVESFFVSWQDGEDDADVNADGGVDGSDVETFFVAWESGGC